MTKAQLSNEDKTPKPSHVEDKTATEGEMMSDSPDLSGLTHLQNQLGNRAVQRLIAQRSGEGAFDLDEETAGQINSARGGGQALDSNIQTQMGETMGQDFSGVRVHTSAEADGLNQQLNAKAFTTGQDIFFKEGAYQPQSSSGQELIAHELTHVVQQGSGAVKGGSGMTVNAPGDAFEQEADAVAKAVTSGSSATAEGGVQRQEMPEEEEPVQLQEMPEEEEEVQMQEMPEEEEDVALD